MSTPGNPSSPAETGASGQLTNHFLIAMPSMQDSYFAKSLVYLCEHNARGALGVVVNRPLDMTLAELFEKVDLPLRAPGFAAQPVYFGGPVQTDRGFVLHRPKGQFQATLAVSEAIGLTSSRDILEAIGETGQPGEVLISLGYAGWGPGQLEEEIMQNAWLTVPADPEVLFSLPPEERQAAALQKLGVNLAFLAEGAGHA